MRVIYSADVYKKLRAYVMGITYEISGLGKINKIGDDFYIEDIKIFTQIVTGGDTVLSGSDIGLFFNELMDQGEDIGKWKLWWHSHATMKALFSQIDYATINDFDNQLPQDNWTLSLVTNHAGAMFHQLDIFQPVRATVQELEWDIVFDDLKLQKEIAKEIREKVHFNKPSQGIFSRRIVKWPKRNSTASNAQFSLPYPPKDINLPNGEVIDAVVK